MPVRYADFMTTPTLLQSTGIARPSAAALMTVVWLQADTSDMPERIYDEHMLLLNLNPTPQRFMAWSEGVQTEIVFREGDIVITPAGTPIGCRSLAPVDLLAVALDPAAVARFAETELGLFLTPQQLGETLAVPDPDLCATGLMLRDAMEIGEAAGAVLFDSLARVLVVKLLLKYGLRITDTDAQRGRISTAQFQRVVHYIQSHIDGSITIEALAREAAMSPSHFSHLFKDTFGKTPMQYVLACRIEQAERLMTDTSRPLAEVAAACGFADQAHFSRSFKQVTGLSPRSWRSARV